MRETIDTLPPRSQSVEDFAASMNTLANRAQKSSASRPGRITLSLSDSYGKVDPIYSRHFNDRQRQLFAGTTRQGAQLCADILDERPAPKLYRQTATLMGNLLLDGIQITLGMPNQDLGRVSADLADARTAFDAAIHRTPERSQYEHQTVGAIFGSLSARALEIHVDSLRLVHDTLPRTAERQTLQRKRLGGLVLDSIGHMSALSDRIATTPESQRGNVVGRFLEATAFTQHAIEWHSQPRIHEDMARFALEREDRPYGYHRPRRGYDVVRMVDGIQQPIQVKASSAGDYHPDIAMWKPTEQVEAVQQSDAIVDVFMQTMMHPNRDDRMLAKMQIDTMFKTVWPATA